jgi:hypothetical protein
VRLLYNSRAPWIKYVYAELERQPFPATTAFVSGGGLLASTELPIKRVSHQREQQKQAINESAPVHVLAAQVETSPQTKVVGHHL